ncbi:aldo keto reductase, partial [Haematococcus lacustris]
LTPAIGPQGHVPHAAEACLACICRTDPPTPNAAQPELDAASIRQALEGSLRRLRTTYIDLYQLHWPNRYAPLWGARQYDLAAAQSWPKVADMEEQVATIGELIKEGKIRYWGLSNETTFGVCRMVEIAKRLGVPPPISIQNDFSLCYRYFEGEWPAGDARLDPGPDQHILEGKGAGCL